MVWHETGVALIIPSNIRKFSSSWKLFYQPTFKLKETILPFLNSYCKSIAHSVQLLLLLSIIHFKHVYFKKNKWKYWYKYVTHTHTYTIQIDRIITWCVVNFSIWKYVSDWNISFASCSQRIKRYFKLLSSSRKFLPPTSKLTATFPAFSLCEKIFYRLTASRRYTLCIQWNPKGNPLNPTITKIKGV